MARKVTEEEVLDWLLKIKSNKGTELMKYISGDTSTQVWSTKSVAVFIAYYYNSHLPEEPIKDPVGRKFKEVIE